MSDSDKSKEDFFAGADSRPRGESYVWLTAMGLAAGIAMTLGLLWVIFKNGIEVFWPNEVQVVTLVEGEKTPFGATAFAGSVSKTRDKLSRNPETNEFEQEYQFFIGNKKIYRASYQYVDVKAVKSMETRDDLIVAERTEEGDAIFIPVKIEKGDGSVIMADDEQFMDKLKGLVKRSNQLRDDYLELERNDIGRISSDLAAIEVKRLALYREYGEKKASGLPEYAELRAEEERLEADNAVLKKQSKEMRDEMESYFIHYKLVSGEEIKGHISELTYVYQPNTFTFGDKIGYFYDHMVEFLLHRPREANTEGGIFPAIFGTFVMTVLMSAAVMPFGVLAAIYLREYAKQGPFVRAVRIAVNNLAGVPSIVYGVFGLGFFVYLVGGSIDNWFFEDRLLAGSPTFGTGGVMWASLTLALMTVPVVVVATEEALASVPRGMREASLACGASKWQTIQRIVMPAAAPGVLTGLILAMARGAGEVAPLMLVGVVKLAPDLPIDGVFPFVHLERKFMHLGFHIYDLGFQSPDSDAAIPMVYATTFLLIMLVVILNLGAIMIRNHLRKKYKSSTF